MKPPHQVNLVIWCNDGRDAALVDSLNEVLRELGADKTIHDEEDAGWHWMGTQGLDKAGDSIQRSGRAAG